MADYDWGLDDCQTPKCRGSRRPHAPWRNHAVHCNVFKMGLYRQAQKDDGFEWSESASAWKCLRGCGCLVWDMHEHKRNVCPTRKTNYIEASDG